MDRNRLLTVANAADDLAGALRDLAREQSHDAAQRASNAYAVLTADVSVVVEAVLGNVERPEEATEAAQ